MKNEDHKTDLTAMRRKLDGLDGKAYWRSLEELSETEEFRQLVEKEFPSNPYNLENSLSRRSFLKLMGASMALAGINACTRQPSERIIPYVTAPEEIVPGEPLYFASAATLGGFATGILVESHMGRPTKIEGNPDHPASLGAADIFTQASILDLYDPDRSRVIKNYGRISTWDKFLNDMRVKLEELSVSDGAGLRILTETVTSPTLANQITAILKKYPLARWHQYQPVNSDNVKMGARRAFGRILDTQYDLSKANVILALDADFLIDMPGSLRYTRQFASRRKPEHEQNKMNRLYSVEATSTLTGAAADHRLSLKPEEIPAFAFAVADELGVVLQHGLRWEGSSQSDKIQSLRDWIRALVRDLKRERGTSLVIAGAAQPPEVHFLVHLINDYLGNSGSTVAFSEPVEAKPEIYLESLTQLAEEMASGAVDVLLVLGGNPAFNAPVDLGFREHLEKVNLCIHLGLHENETSDLCHWHIPETHFLEDWSDARAFDGTASIIQPLIAPLYGGKSAHEVLAVLQDESGQSSHDNVKGYWKSQYSGGDFERHWKTCLHDGVVPNTTAAMVRPRLQIEDGRLRIEDRGSGAEDSGFTLIFRPDPTVWDGRFANNGWLQETPKSLTKLTWDNAVLISPADAEAQNLENGDTVELEVDGGRLEAPVWITPGQAKGSLTLHFGYGRRRVGAVGSGTGVDGYALRSKAGFWSTAAQLRKTGERQKFATTQHHNLMENRHLVRAGTVEEFHENPEFVHELSHDPPEEMSFYPPYEYDGYAWGMAIDLNSCIGCNACSVACQAENNIPVVGKDQVIAGREMNWIRIDRYYGGDLDNPETYHQPVMCMHCENAPCEPVCPVGATTHSDEGLNEMVYNRCVGTRYCANNCPYKVRRFNFLQYADLETESLKLQRNPDVTVRTRGVMEKCTYCVQRINHARIDAKKEDREIRDGEVVTACQQVCPADAIVFGDINDPNSRVAKMKADHRNYGILTEIGTRPRTSYLAKIKNPNPEIIEL